MAETQYNIKILRESLTGLCAQRDEQLRLNKVGLEYLDDVFDPMPLDFLPLLEEKGVIRHSFLKDFRELYHQIEQVVGHLEWDEQDEFIAKNGEILQEWRVKAKALLSKLPDL